MSYFVSQHGNKLLGCMIFDQGIEKSDSFVLAKTGEEGVRFSGPFGSVHYINALKREVHLIGIRLDRLTKFTIFQWFKCIEKRHKDRKSTRLNSSHVAISYAVFCVIKNN